ncbi:MAG: DoxX family protein [Chlamydiae bacterium]|nr:DoxX family protein [Chlamydiota bacterium]
MEKSSWRCNLAQWGLLWMRLALGMIFIAHGCQKVFGLWGGHGLSQTVAFINQNLGIPVPWAYAAAFTELLGGVSVLLGLLTRLGALGLASVMAVAIYKVNWANGFFMNWFNTPNVGHGIEYSLALIGLSWGLVFAGPGCFSLDTLLFSRSCKEEGEKTGSCQAS